MKKGLVHIYTGNGKGKTTSAVGLGVRALGSGFKVYYAFFHKRPEIYGYAEIKNLEKLGATIMGIAKGHPHLDKSIDEDSIKYQTKEGVDALTRTVKEEHIDMLIMDEILISVRDGFLDEETLIKFIKNKPNDLELVLTGRGATVKIIELADYVSEIQKIKHPFDKNIASRKGVEF